MWGWVGAKERESLGGGQETWAPPIDLLCSLSSCLWPAFCSAFHSASVSPVLGVP